MKPTISVIETKLNVIESSFSTSTIRLELDNISSGVLWFFDGKQNYQIRLNQIRLNFLTLLCLKEVFQNFKVDKE